MNYMYFVKACLPGYSIDSGYLVLAKNNEDARNKILMAFPNSEISYVERQDANLVFETKGLASCPLMGCCKQTSKDYEKYKKRYLEEYGTK